MAGSILKPRPCNFEKSRLTIPKWGDFGMTTCTANVYSSITDKLMHLFVASTLKCLFWDFLELCDNYRQISVELPNNKNTQRKNWENFEIMKKNS